MLMRGDNDMSADQPIDYKALEKGLQENPAAIGPGELCESCSSQMPSRFIFGKVIYHPAGRVTLHRKD